MSIALNPNERLLYRVLEKANLARYFDAFISQGGDDVIQLCEAGNKEFLEIMALVGMSSKPLHVRRLQKILHEWVINPASFEETINGPRKPTGINESANGGVLAAFLQQTTYTSTTDTSTPSLPSSRDRKSATPGVRRRQSSGHPSFEVTTSNGMTTNGDVIVRGRRGSRSSSISNSIECLRANKPSSPLSEENSDQEFPVLNRVKSFSRNSTTSPSPTKSTAGFTAESRTGFMAESRTGFMAESTAGSMALFPCIQLHGSQLKEIERTAAEISAELPFYAPKPLNMKKPIDREIDEVMNIPDEAPNRMELFRKYGAIYGRFDSKRRYDKQMNFHEMCVNEAAAQLCKHNPCLLTRREELFILARQVVRQAGFQYSKGQYRSKEYLITSSTTDVGDGVHPITSSKKSKIESTSSISSTISGDLTFSKHRLLFPASWNLVINKDFDSNYTSPSSQLHGLSDLCQPPDHDDLPINVMNSITSSTGNKADLSTRQRRRHTSIVGGAFGFSFKKNESGPAPAPAPAPAISLTTMEVDEQREWLRDTGIDSCAAIVTQQETQKPLSLTPSAQPFQVAAAAETEVAPPAAVRDIKTVTRELRSNKNNLLVGRDVMAMIKPERILR